MSGILSLLAAGSGSSSLALYDGFSSTRGMIASNLSGVTHANVRNGHWARTDITKLKIPVFNYYGAAEAAPGATMGVTASVEYPAGTLTQILFAASASGTVADGGTLISDFLTIAIPNGERYWIRLHLTCSAGIVYTPADAGGNYVDNDPNFMGDAFEDTATDRTMTGEITPSEDSLAYYTPVIAPTTAPTIMIVGDSIDYGTTDALDISGDVGIVARTIGPLFGYFDAAMPGEAASDFVSHHTQKLLLLSYCSHVFVGHGTNDLFAGHSKATIEADLTTIYGYFSSKTVFGRTMVPRTTSDDNWATTGLTHQTVLAAESVRSALNADLRSSFHPGGGVFDTSAVVESSTSWVANETNDGIHPNRTGYLAAQTSGAINTALIGTPATPATETGSAWGDHGTKITISTRRRANDTACPNTNGNPSTTVRGAGSNSSGKKYFEIECLGAQTSGFYLGLITSDQTNGASLDDYMGDTPMFDSFGIGNNFATNFVSGTAFTATNVGAFSALAGDIFGMAVDFTNKFAYMHRNGVWFLSANPASGATGTGHCATWTGTPTLFPGMTLYGFDSGTTQTKPVRLRTGNSLQYLALDSALISASFLAWG